METNIKLRKFDPSTMVDHAVVLVVGKRGSGKSIMLADLLYFQRDIPVGVVMSATEAGNKFYSKYVPDLFIHNDFDEDVLENVLRRQKKMIWECAPNPNAFIVLDDCVYDAGNLKTPVLREMCLNGRHWKLSLSLSTQYLISVPVDLRSNVDYVFALGENSLANRERLYRSFFGVVPSFDMFNRIFDIATEGYGALVLNNRSRSTKIEDTLFYYEAEPDRQFRMGSAQIWRTHAQRYNPRYVEKEIYSTESREDKKKKKKKKRR